MFFEHDDGWTTKPFPANYGHPKGVSDLKIQKFLRLRYNFNLRERSFIITYIESRSFKALLREIHDKNAKKKLTLKFRMTIDDDAFSNTINSTAVIALFWIPTTY